MAALIKVDTVTILLEASTWCPPGALDEEYTYSVIVTEPQDRSSTGSVAIRYGEFEGPPEEFLKEFWAHSEEEMEGEII